MKKITVIIPVYNVEEYLEECLASIENQTMDLNDVEVIIINDGSKDNSLKICKKYLKRNKSWVLINKKNEGLSAARNDGLDISKGEYIIFLDSDDYLAKDALENMYSIAKENNSDIVIGRTKKFNSKDSVGAYTDKYIKKLKTFKFIDNKEIINVVSACGKLFRKKTIGKLRFIKGVVHEDNYFTIMMYIKSKKITTIPNYYYYRRLRESKNLSIMQNLSLKTFKDLLLNYKSVVEQNPNLMINNYTIDFFLKAATRYVIRELKKEDHKGAKKEIKKFLNDLYKQNFLSYSYYLYYLSFIPIYFVILKIRALILGNSIKSLNIRRQ